MSDTDIHVLDSHGKKKTTKIILSQENEFLRRKAAAWEAVGAIASRLGMGQPIEVVLNEAVRECALAVQADLFGVMMVDNTGASMSVVSSVGLDAGMLPAIEITPEQKLDIAARKGLPAWAVSEPMAKDGESESFLSNSIFLEMKYQGTPIGVLFAARPTGGEEFSQTEQGVLVALANQIAGTAFIEGPARLLMNRERVERELNFAHTLKGRLLKSSAPTLENINLCLKPLRSLDPAGDFYDFITLPDGKVFSVVGETSGRGIQASLNIADILFLIRGGLAGGKSLPEITHSLNRHLVVSGRRGHMVSLCMLILDQSAGEIEIVKAGNTGAYIVKGDSASTVAGGYGTPLGVISNYEIASEKLSLDSGTALLLHTDGLNKCCDDYEDGSDSERLEQIIKDARQFVGEEESECVAGLIADFISLHNSSEMMSDDVTFLSVELK